MSHLLLLRHARAAWPEPGMRDFDRPLDPAGVGEADRMGRIIAGSVHRPRRVICSSARRARETWSGISRHLAVPDNMVQHTDSLFTGDGGVYLDLLRATAETGALMMIGHNPMIEDLAYALAPEGNAEALEARSGGFPVAGLAIIAFAAGLDTAAPGRGRLEAFLAPD